jgi:hypothetical protein
VVAIVTEHDMIDTLLSGTELVSPRLNLPQMQAIIVPELAAQINPAVDLG